VSSSKDIKYSTTWKFRGRDTFVFFVDIVFTFLTVNLALTPP